MDKFEETEVMICQCSSLEHQAKFYHFKDDRFDEFSILIHLHTHRNVFKRIWYSVKYIFGYTSRFGAWDEMMFSKEDRIRLRDFLIKNCEDIK